MTINKYVGARYVPLYIGVHSTNTAYEPLSIVSNEAKTKTYTSKQSVPVGIELENEEYWAQSGYFQDGITEITPDISELASYEQPIFTITKDESSAEIKLETPDAYAAGNSFNNSYVLNEVTAPGVYVIKPSACAEIPTELESNENPATLSVVIYRYKSGEKDYYIQQITSGTGIYTRDGDGATWNEWSAINAGSTLEAGNSIKIEDGKINVVNVWPANLGVRQALISYVKGTTEEGKYGLYLPLGDGLKHDDMLSRITLKPATVSTIGGVRVGSGLSIDSDGILSVTGSGTSTSYSPGEGINISGGVISVDKAWSEETFTWVSDQSAASGIEPVKYTYNASSKTVTFVLEDSMFGWNAAGTYTSGEGIVSTSLPKAYSFGVPTMITGAICDENGENLESCYATIAFDSTGSFSAIYFHNPKAVKIDYQTVYMRFEYQAA